MTYVLHGRRRRIDVRGDGGAPVRLRLVAALSRQHPAGRAGDCRRRIPAAFPGAARAFASCSWTRRRRRAASLVGPLEDRASTDCGVGASLPPSAWPPSTASRTPTSRRSRRSAGSACCSARSGWRRSCCATCSSGAANWRCCGAVGYRRARAARSSSRRERAAAGRRPRLRDRLRAAWRSCPRCSARGGAVPIGRRSAAAGRGARGRHVVLAGGGVAALPDRRCSRRSESE